MFLTIPYALEAVKKRTISLLTSDVKSRKSVAVKRRGMEETLKSLNIMTRRTNDMWDVLLASEEAKTLTRNIFTTKSVRMKDKYMGIRRTKITLHGMPMDAVEDQSGSLLCKVRAS